MAHRDECHSIRPFEESYSDDNSLKRSKCLRTVKEFGVRKWGAQDGATPTEAAPPTPGSSPEVKRLTLSREEGTMGQKKEVAFAPIKRMTS